ncbi:MAG TPA: alpha/beta fold hydrolase [Kamptonema sp.]|nr:alpha/beta fold hydrolase [Kamptonema sp.]
MSFLYKLLTVVGGMVAIAYCGACIFLFTQQTKFIFAPTPLIETTPDFFQLRYENVWLPVAATNGKLEGIHGWWVPNSAPRRGNEKVVLYLHGNGINMGANIEHANRFHQVGLSVFLIDYRGYGRSTGNFPTESQVYQDAETAWHYLVKERGINPSQILIYGHSLGGAIAIDLALRHPDAAALIVESSFTSIRAMVDYQNQFWMFPVNLLLTQRFDSIAKVSKLQMPIFFIHGTADNVVPFEMSKKLFEAAPEPKQLYLIPNAGHNNTAQTAGAEYLQRVRGFVEQLGVGK